MSANKKSYYGPFFWLATISFVVPLFVAYAAFDKLRPTTKPDVQPDASGVDQQLWDYLLRTYVADGLVDYAGLSRDYLFKTYLQQVASAEPDKLSSSDEKLALYCNAYNALVINGVITHKIHERERNVLAFKPSPVVAQLEVLNEELQLAQNAGNAKRVAKLEEEIQTLENGPGFFQLQEHLFANQTVSLDRLEHEMIRPVFQEPRVHVALVCAAKSCPEIRAEAYVGKRMDRQLQDQAKQFANDQRYVNFNVEDGSLTLSPILSWYGQDWDAQGGYLAWLAKLVEDVELREKIVAAQANEVAVNFSEYNWELNSSEIGAAGATGTKGFGSGSVPNE